VLATWKWQRTKSGRRTGVAPLGRRRRARAGARTARPTENVGAAQDLLALNISLASVMQAGRWKDTRMPMRYAERVLATRGGMAQAAKDQGKL
jgi:hypothetical protein